MLTRWKLALVIVGTVVALAVANAMASPEAMRFRQGVVTAWLLCMLMLIGSCVLLYMRWRMSREAPAGWLAVTAACAAVYVASYVLRMFIHPPSQRVMESGILDIVTMVVIGVLVHKAARAEALPRIGPVGTAVGAVVVGALLQWPLLVHGTFLPWTGGYDVMAGLAIGLAGGLCMLSLARTRHFGPTIRNQLLVVCALLTVSRIIVAPDPTEVGLRAAAGVLLAVCAVAVFAREALYLVLRGRDHAYAVGVLQHTQPLVGVAQDEQLHELRASLAGVSTAVHLLARDDSYLTTERRSRLTDMLEAEVGRLERLVCRTQQPHEVAELPVEELLEPLVTSRRLAGQEVHLDASGCRVVGAPDSIVEAINILLVNAAEHAPGSPVRISAVDEHDWTYLRVSDQGPGVPAQMEKAIFTKGVRGKGSRGQGIGLDLARRLVAAQGGSLRLAEPGPRGGTTFEVALPVPMQAAEVC